MPEDNAVEPVRSLAELRRELDEVRRVRRKLAIAYLRAALANSGLPGPMQAAVRRRLSGRADLTVAEAQLEVEAQRQTWAALQEQGIAGNRRAGVSRVRDGLDRLQLACDRLLGLHQPDSQRDVPRLSGLRELYLLLTGDYELRGQFVPDRVALTDATATTLATVVGNALNKALVSSFAVRPQWWKPIVVEEGLPPANDVAWITLGGLGDLADEGGPYGELASLNDGQEASHRTKRGGYIGITLEAISRDDVPAVRQIPRKLGLAAWRTLSASIASLFVGHGGVGPYWPAAQATYRLFDKRYGNLGSAPLSAASWDATVRAMRRRTPSRCGKRLGLPPRWLLVPIELEETALAIGSAGEPGTGNDDANGRAGSLGVVTVPEFTASNDWAAAADPQDLPGICIAYRFGRTPELFVAGDAAAGSMFANGEMPIRVRFLYSVGVAEPRALYKHNVV